MSFRHASVAVNFGKAPTARLPFTCRMLADAASAHAQVAPGKAGKCELLLPVAFPDEGEAFRSNMRWSLELKRWSFEAPSTGSTAFWRRTRSTRSSATGPKLKVRLMINIIYQVNQKCRNSYTTCPKVFFGNVFNTSPGKHT